MDNYSTYTDNYAMSLDSAGVAQKKFNIYQESTQAHLDRMTASWQNLGKSLIDSNFVKTIIDLGTEFAKMAPLIANFVISLTIVIGLFKTLKVEGAGLPAIFASLGTGLKGIVTGANLAKIAVAGLSTFGVMALVTALGFVVGRISDAIQKNKEWKGSIEDVITAKEKLVSATDDTEDDENYAQFKSAAEKRISLIKEELKYVQSKIEAYTGTNYESIRKSFADQAYKLIDEKSALEKQIKAIEDVKKSKIELQKINDANIQRSIEATQTNTGETSSIDDLTESFDSAVSSMSDMAQLYNEINEGGKISTETLIELLQKYPQYNQQIMRSIGNKEAELNLTELLFEVGKQDAIAQNNALIEQIKKEAELNGLKLDGFKIRKASMEQALAYLPVEDLQRSAISTYLNSKEAKDTQAVMDRIESINASSKTISGLEPGDWDTKDKKPTDPKETAYKLDEKYTLRIKELDNQITKSEGESLQNQIDALEAKEQYLKDISKEISDKETLLGFEGDIFEIQNKQLTLQEQINKEKQEATKATRDGAIATLEANIEAAKNISKDAEIKATQALIDYLKDVGVQLVKEKASQEDIANNAKTIAGLESDILSINKDITEEKEKQVEDQIQSVKDQIADDKFHLEAQQKIAEDALDDKIRLINLEIDALEDKNETLKEEEERQQKILDILKEKDNLANTLKEKNTKMLTEKGWEWIANPKAVRESQEKVKQLESDMASWEAENARKKVIKEKQVKIVAIEEEKRISKLGYDNQFAIIDLALHNIEAAEQGSYATRLAAVTKFVNDYNAQMARQVGAVNIPAPVAVSSGGGGGVPSSYSVQNTDAIAEANRIIAEAQKAWNAANETEKLSGVTKQTTDAKRDAHILAEQARGVIVGEQYKTTSASGVSQYTDATGMLIRDSGGIMPDGSTSLNLSGKPELALNNSQVGKVYNLIKALPPMALNGTSSSASSSLGYNFSGPIYVTANNADQFMESMRNYTRLTRK